MMRNTFALASLVGMLALGPVAAHQASKDEAGQSAVLKVKGMHCDQCVKSVEDAAKKVDGVISVKASHPKSQAEVTYDAAKTSPEAIAKAISKNTGYKAEAPKK
jgi:copper chaperone CopZ